MEKDIKLGVVQRLIIDRHASNGVYLTALDSSKSVLLPANQVTDDMQDGNSVEVFVYKDSEDRIIATTKIPPISLGKLARLTVKDVTKIGAFLDWGLAKDLFLPFKEQSRHPGKGEEVLVGLYIDKSDRLCATMRLYKYLETGSEYKKGDSVSGTVYEIIDNFGTFIAVDDKFSAMIPKREVIKTPLRPGDSITATVSNVLADGKLELTLRSASTEMEETNTILEMLEKAGGFLPYGDKTDSDTIRQVFNMSKKSFKRDLGHLYKERKIVIEENGIRLA
ncbi:MAG: RNA-binding protein [Lachnospiraceae bacterium]|nr:RNA-binding protein [Lachnospiraceae bacterium]